MAGAALTGRADAERLDAADPLAPFRERFVIEDPETIYLDGNSLGRLPLATRDRLAELTLAWGSQLVRGWHEWIDLPERIGDLLATGVLGARAGEVIVSDSTTVNLFKLAGAVLDTRPGAIVTDAENFPTDRYVLDGLARLHDRELRILEVDPLDGPQPDDVERACAGADVALVALSHVAYRSGALADIERINRAATPAPVLWDLSHSAGALPIELESRGVQLAVGCTYKYLNAGPGRPGLPVRARGATGRSAHPDPGLVWPARPVPHGARLRPGAGRPRVPRGNADDPRAAAQSRRARSSWRRRGSSGCTRRPSSSRSCRDHPRRAPRAARIPARKPARPGPPRRPREPRPRRGVADLPGPDRARAV